jgi:hypothetical protein
MIMTDQEQPLLGLATTRELLRELQVRADVTVQSEADKMIMMPRIGEMLRSLTPTTLDYRTVEGERTAKAETEQQIAVSRLKEVEYQLGHLNYRSLQDDPSRTDDIARDVRKAREYIERQDG